jgi:predicted RecB family nuclease
MRRNSSGQLVYSPSDLVRYLSSPFASWMDRYYLENPGALTPDEDTEDERLIAQTGQAHEQVVLAELKAMPAAVVEIQTKNAAAACEQTLSAIEAKSPVIYQAALHSEHFAGFADFLMLDEAGRSQVWDTKLARSPKPYYAIQLCCYADMPRRHD